MKNIFLFLLMLLPGFAGAEAEVALSTGHSESRATFEQADTQHGFLKRVTQKLLLKRLKKVAAGLGDGDGGFASISGLALGVLGILPWLISSELGIFLSFASPLIGLLGLLLSIIGLIRSRSWQGNKFMQGLAVAGIVLNGLLIALGIYGIFQLSSI